jgi:hypothetical protein
VPVACPSWQPTEAIHGHSWTSEYSANLHRSCSISAEPRSSKLVMRVPMRAKRRSSLTSARPRSPSLATCSPSSRAGRVLDLTIVEYAAAAGRLMTGT